MKLLPTWEFCAISASGLSGGLLTAWNPQRVKCRAFETCDGILVKASFRGLSTPLAILNVYGPYRNQELFWEKAHRGDLLSIPNLILGGDLNLILKTFEIWGQKASPDPLSSHFQSLFDSVGLVDIAPPNARPT